MLVFGDVVAFLAILIGSAAAAWGSMILASLLFAGKSAIAARRIESSPWKMFFTGFAALVITSVPILILLNLPNPLAKTLGFIVLCFVLGVAIVGGGGLTKLISERVRDTGGAERPYLALSKGAMLVVLSCLFPIFGWFFLAPVAICVTLGAGTASLLGRASVSVPSPEVA